MMHNKIQMGWTILLLMMVSLVLTACVRPYPGSEASAAEPTAVPMESQPVVIPEIPINTPESDLTPAEPVEVEGPTPVPVPAVEAEQEETIYIVVAGDTLYKIAIAHDVTVDDIAAANGIVNIDALEIGQELIIPLPGSNAVVDTEDVEQGIIEEPDTETATEPEQETTITEPGGVYIVKPGDNLFRIGLQHGCTVEQLARHNGITTPNRISVGMEIEIPVCN